MADADVMIKLLKDLGKILGPTAVKELRKKLEDYNGKPHGSKIKEGAYKDCTIELVGDKACIVVDPEAGQIVLLTSDTVKSCVYKKEKEKLHKGKFHTYYYYDILYKNGTYSYARMRKKYRDAMLKYV